MAIEIISASPAPPPKPGLIARLLTWIADYLSQLEPPIRPARNNTANVQVVCISDTHNARPSVVKGDLLLHAGDLSQDGSFDEIQRQLNCIASLPHPHKIVIAGNHDILLDSKACTSRSWKGLQNETRSKDDLNWHDLIYLQDETIQLDLANGRTLKIHGSPWTQEYGTWAFQYPHRLQPRFWDGRMRSDVDILVTHGPPRGHLDQNTSQQHSVHHSGDASLLREILRVRPRLVVFGHIHAGRGSEHLRLDLYGRGRERIRHLGGQVSALVQLLFGFCVMWIGRALGRETSLTTLVNAAIDQESRATAGHLIVI